MTAEVSANDLAKSSKRTVGERSDRRRTFEVRRLHDLTVDFVRFRNERRVKIEKEKEGLRLAYPYC